MTFARGSRYENLPLGVYDDGRRQVPYVLLRRIPDTFQLRQLHRVETGDRLDLVAYRYFDDPEQFWRVCDANGALRPEDLVAVPGSRIAIPLAVR